MAKSDPMEMSRFGERDILLTFQEAAQFLRVSRATMYRLLASGKLVGHKVGRTWRFYKTDLHEFIAAEKHSPEAATQAREVSGGLA
jgi:excisionase family DNA binding protein